MISKNIKHFLAFIKGNQRLVLVVGTGLVCLFAVLVTVPIINKQPLGFDEAFNLQAPLNVARHGKYASFGAVDKGVDKPFDPYLSTGPSTTTPIAIVFKLFGVGVLQARVVMLLFYLATLCIAAWIVFNYSKSALAVLSPLSLLLLCSSGFLFFKIDILGEIPAILFALCSILSFSKKKYALAGIFASLAVLSKFLMLFLVMAGFFCLLLSLIKKQKDRRGSFKNLILWTIGVAVPTITWEVIRYIQVGGSRFAYKDNLRQFVDYVKANGSGIGDTHSAGLTVSHKLNMVLSNLTIQRGLYITIGVTILAILILRRKKLKTSLLDNGYSSIFIALYLGWWLIISNGGYARYTVPLVGVFIPFIFILILGSPVKKREKRQSQLIALLAILLLISVSKFYFPYKTLNYPISLSEQKTIASQIQKYNPDHLNHLGWWQNPEMLFLTGLHSTVMDQVKIGDQFTLLLTPTMKNIVPTEYEQGKKRCNYVVFENVNHILCTGIK